MRAIGSLDLERASIIRDARRCVVCLEIEHSNQVPESSRRVRSTQDLSTPLSTASVDIFEAGEEERGAGHYNLAHWQKQVFEKRRSDLLQRLRMDKALPMWIRPAGST